MDSRLPALTATAIVVLLFCACTEPARTAGPSPSPAAGGCRNGPPEAGVYNTDRLKVLDRCKHAEGVVVDVAFEADGDYHLWFRPDPGYEYLLGAENHFQAQPAMLAEITPACSSSTSPPDARSAARCPRSKLPVPAIGQHMAVDGPWVLDTDHGWREIHPVDSIQIR